MNAGVSIVIVNWNTRGKLRRVLHAIRSSRVNRELEVIVVDNASSDRSVEAVRSEFPDVTVLPQRDNLGFGAGVNRGAAIARHEFLLLVNTDVAFDRDAIERFVSAAERCRHSAIFGPRIVDDVGVVQRSHWSVPTLGTMLRSATGAHRVGVRPAPLEGSASVDCVSGCVFLIRRNAFEQLKGFDEDFFMYFEETDLCRRARVAGMGVRYEPVAEFRHEGGGSGHRVRGELFRTFRASEVMFHRKRAGWLAGIAARLISRSASCLRALGLIPLTVLPNGLGSRARGKLALHATYASGTRRSTLRRRELPCAGAPRSVTNRGAA